MALTTAEFNDWLWIRQADAANRPLPLGPKGHCSVVSGFLQAAGGSSWHEVKHHVGVNANLQSPIFLRSYFDPGTLPLVHYRYLGYVQTLAPKVFGVPVRPNLFGGPLTRPTSLFGNSCVDFMGPADAQARQDPFGRSLPPVYPFNAMLTTTRSSIADFAKTDAPLGFILVPPGSIDRPPGNDAADCASLVAQLNMSFLTPDGLPKNMSCLKPEYGALNAFTYPSNGRLKLAMEPLTFSMSTTEFAQNTLIGHAVQLLQNCADLTAQDRAITLADLRFARFVGRYVLVNIATPENMDPVLCIWSEASGNPNLPVAIKVTFINYDALDDAEEAATYAFLDRMATFRGESRITNAPPRVATAKGRGAPTPLPMVDGQVVVAITVTDMVYGMFARPRRASTDPYMRPISGVSYDIEFAYDAFARKLVYRGYTPPRIQYDLSTVEAAVSDYQRLLRLGIGKVDVSNFDLVGVPQGEHRPAAPQ